MSRSSASLRASAFNAAFSASKPATHPAPRWSSLPRGAVVVAPEPSLSAHSFNAPREMPRSAAMPYNVAPGVDSYKSTARRRNSSV